jgi:hypothetical protein
LNVNSPFLSVGVLQPEVGAGGIGEELGVVDVAADGGGIGVPGGPHDGAFGGAVARCGGGVATAERVPGEVTLRIPEGAHVAFNDDCNTLGAEGSAEAAVAVDAAQDGPAVMPEVVGQARRARTEQVAG